MPQDKTFHHRCCSCVDHSKAVEKNKHILLNLSTYTGHVNKSATNALHLLFENAVKRALLDAKFCAPQFDSRTAIVP